VRFPATPFAFLGGVDGDQPAILGIAQDRAQHEQASEAVRRDNPFDRVRFSQAMLSSGLVKVFTGRSPNTGTM
jgi:hypothetical protein